MKRSKVIETIVNWAKPEIYEDVYSCTPYREENLKIWADNLLYILETEIGMLPPENEDRIYIRSSGNYEGLNMWDSE